MGQVGGPPSKGSGTFCATGSVVDKGEGAATGRPSELSQVNVGDS